jgi:alpha-beta hydrolase superfamily lysophospholipase
MNTTDTRDPAANTWTVAYRNRRANHFKRVTDWSGTWEQATQMAGLVNEAHPDLEVWYTGTLESEQAGFVHPDDCGNLLVPNRTGRKSRRVQVRETGSLAALGIMHPEALTVKTLAPEAGKVAAGLTEPMQAALWCAVYPEGRRPSRFRNSRVRVGSWVALMDRGIITAAGAATDYRHQLTDFGRHVVAFLLARAEVSAYESREYSSFAEQMYRVDHAGSDTVMTTDELVAAVAGRNGSPWAVHLVGQSTGGLIPMAWTEETYGDAVVVFANFLGVKRVLGSYSISAERARREAAFAPVQAKVDGWTLTDRQAATLWMQGGARYAAVRQVYGDAALVNSARTQRELIRRGLMQDAAIGRPYGISPAGRAALDAMRAETELEAYGESLEHAADGFFAVSSRGVPMHVYILTTLGSHLIRSYDLDAPCASGMDLAAYGSLSAAREGLAMFREVMTGNRACCFDSKAEARAAAAAALASGLLEG